MKRVHTRRAGFSHPRTVVRFRVSKREFEFEDLQEGSPCIEWIESFFSVSPFEVFVGIGESGNFYQEFGSGFFKEREIREV